MIHSEEPIEKLEDMAGKTLRGPTRIINDLLSELGAEPVGMPLPAIPEALSKGVINGTVIPWEVTPSIRLTELVSNHTEFWWARGALYRDNRLVMNKAAYEALPDDLRAILDAESGAAMAQALLSGDVRHDAPGREIAVNAGNTIITLDEAEVARWKAAAQPVIDRWVAEMDAKGIDGAGTDRPCQRADRRKISHAWPLKPRVLIRAADAAPGFSVCLGAWEGAMYLTLSRICGVHGAPVGDGRRCVAVGVVVLTVVSIIGACFVSARDLLWSDPRASMTTPKSPLAPRFSPFCRGASI